MSLAEYICPACHQGVLAPLAMESHSAPCPKCKEQIAAWPAPKVRAAPPPLPSSIPTATLVQPPRSPGPWFAAGIAGLVLLVLGAVSFTVFVWVKRDQIEAAARGEPSVPVVRSPADLAGKEGQVVQLTGVLKVAGVTGAKREYVTLNLAWGEKSTVYCIFEPGHQSWYNTLDLGQPVTVVGTVTGFRPGVVELEGCRYIPR